MDGRFHDYDSQRVALRTRMMKIVDKRFKADNNSVPARQPQRWTRWRGRVQGT